MRCQGQLEPGVRDALWPQIMKWDRIGAQCGPRKDGVSEGVMRGPSFAQLVAGAGGGAITDRGGEGETIAPHNPAVLPMDPVEGRRCRAGRSAATIVCSY